MLSFLKEHIDYLYTRFTMISVELIFPTTVLTYFFFQIFMLLGFIVQLNILFYVSLSEREYDLSILIV